ncbi:MAG: hypothetical protein HZA77_09855 [Candidatus Schekmanbacteria bacterium]|nr:hypothetical protein [Candidatus Schekmanbacteria bacterium]
MSRRFNKYMIIFIALAAFVSAEREVLAHHLAGLPHYGYQENYPKYSKVEEKRTSGDYEITFSYYKIYNTNTVELVVYIKNIKTGKPYSGSNVTFIVYSEAQHPEDTDPYVSNIATGNTYRAGWKYEIDGIYFMRVSFADEDGSIINEEFKMQIGEVGTNWKWIAITGGAFLLLFCIVVLKKRADMK